MTGIVLTQSGTFIIGDIARILGWIMNVLFNFLDQVFGIQNIGLCIILFTLAVLPMLNSGGGIQLFNAEVPGITHDKLRPRIS